MSRISAEELGYALHAIGVDERPWSLEEMAVLGISIPTGATIQRVEVSLSLTDGTTHKLSLTEQLKRSLELEEGK